MYTVPVNRRAIPAFVVVMLLIALAAWSLHGSFGPSAQERSDRSAIVAYVQQRPLPADRRFPRVQAPAARELERWRVETHMDGTTKVVTLVGAAGCRWVGGVRADSPPGYTGWKRADTSDCWPSDEVRAEFVAGEIRNVTFTAMVRGMPE